MENLEKGMLTYDNLGTLLPENMQGREEAEELLGSIAYQISPGRNLVFRELQRTLRTIAELTKRVDKPIEFLKWFDDNYKGLSRYSSGLSRENTELGNILDQYLTVQTRIFRRNFIGDCDFINVPLEEIKTGVRRAYNEASLGRSNGQFSWAYRPAAIRDKVRDMATDPSNR